MQIACSPGNYVNKGFLGGNRWSPLNWQLIRLIFAGIPRCNCTVVEPQWSVMLDFELYGLLINSIGSFNKKYNTFSFLLISSAALEQTIGSRLI